MYQAHQAYQNYDGELLIDFSRATRDTSGTRDTLRVFLTLQLLTPVLNFFILNMFFDIRGGCNFFSTISLDMWYHIQLHERGTEFLTVLP